MENISCSVTKKDHAAKVSGRSIFAGDYDSCGMLCGKLLRSSYASARILSVTLPQMPAGYLYVDRKDVPGINIVHIVHDDTPVFAEDTVAYIGEPIGMVCGPDEAVCQALLDQIHVAYQVLEPVLDLRQTKEAFFDYAYEKGNWEAAFREADQIFSEEFETGHQDHAYLEPQIMIAEPEPDGGMYVHGSLQCIYYVHSAIKQVLGCRDSQLHIHQDVTGGGFGGKEDFPSILGAQVAVAARKAGKPVRCQFDRREDLEYSPKRHPSLCTYRAAVKDGRVIAMDIDVKFNAGAYTTLSDVVLQRGLICACGVYDIPHLRVHGQALKTNSAPCGAYRGFGAPQTFFAAEMTMEHIAKALGVDPLRFKETHLVRQGDISATGGRFHYPVPLPDMIDAVDRRCDYRAKRAAYEKEQSGRYRRGIGISLSYHGCGFTGSGEQDFIKAVVRLRKYRDGSVEILAANGDIGQGLRTTFPKIVAHELNLPLERVFFRHPDTACVPDSGPTVASRSLMIVGELLRRAAVQLREQWEEDKDQVVEERYVHPDFTLPFSLSSFHGDPYPCYAWAVQAVEVELDSYTGLSRLVNVCTSFDVGTPIDENIVRGQMEGGVLQGLGYASMEKMDYDRKGRIRNNRFSDYLIPTSVDVPRLEVLLHVTDYPYGPYGAKGAGELPLVGTAPAYVSAVEQALGQSVRLDHAPFTPEDSIAVLAKEAK